MGVSASVTKTDDFNEERLDYETYKQEVLNETSDNGDIEKVTNYKDVLECPPRYPSPFAPTSRKKDIFTPEKFRQAKERVESVPTSVLGDYSLLLKHLTADVKSDLEKVWSIYQWIVNLNLSDPAHGKYSAEDTPKGYLRWIHDGQGDIPSLFAILCRRSNIKCVIIDGISKGAEYEVGMPESELHKMRDRWNAVYLDKNWRFVHPTWGNKASKDIKSYFFLTEPEEFNTWCRPDERQWQLLTTMVTMSEFTYFPYCTAEFFMMNMKVLTPKAGKIRVRNGHLFVEIATTRNIGKTVVVNYHLHGKKVLKPKPITNGPSGETTFRTITTNRTHEIEDEGGEEKTEDFDIPTEFPADLENYVFMWRKDAHIMFDIQLPVSGSYIFSVQAGQMNPDYTVSPLVLIAELKLYCLDKINEENLDIFPDVPEIGWGVTPHCLVRGIRPVTHVDGEVFVLPDSDTIIRFELDHEYEFDVEMVGANYAEDLQQYSSHEVHNNVLTVRVRIPGEGQYGLKIYAKENDDSDFVNVCNYFLIFNKASSNIEKFPKRMLRDRLEKCIENGTRHELIEALKDFKLHNVPDRGEVHKAQDKIGYFDDMKALNDAIKRKNPTYLQKAIQDAKQSRFTTELEDDIKKAQICLAKLNRMEGFLHPIAKLEQLTLSEIRCYNWPPEVVRDVLMATYVLLGENYEYLQDWDYVQGLMSKVGREGLKNKVLHLDSDTVPMSQVDLADIIIEPHKLDEAREASNSAAALYQWVRHIVTEKKSQQQSANSSVVDDATQKRTKKKNNSKPGQIKVINFDKSAGKVTKNFMTQFNNNQQRDRLHFKYSSNAKSSEYRDLKAVRNTNISSQHRFAKPEKNANNTATIRKPEKNPNNIIGMKIVNENSSPKTIAPDTKRSPSQKTPSSKNVTPTQKSPSGKNITPTQKSTSSKNVTPTQNSTGSKNVTPTQKSTSSKNVTPTQKSNTDKNSSSMQKSPSSKHPSPSNKHSSPSQKSPANKYISPTQKSPTTNNSKNPNSPFDSKSPNGKISTQRFQVIKSPQKSPPAAIPFHDLPSKSPPYNPPDAPPHRSPLVRPPPEEFLSPRRLSPVSQAEDHNT